MITITHSDEQTELFGAELAARLKPGDCLAMYGPLGAGKTALTRGICRGLHCTVDVHSPTFNIVNYYPGNIEVAHVDLYRIGEDIEDIGWDDLLSGEYIVIIEWSEKAGNYLPENRINISFHIIDLLTREIKVDFPDDSSA